MPTSVFLEKLVLKLSGVVHLPTTVSPGVSVFVLLSVWLASSLTSEPSTGGLEDCYRKGDRVSMPTRKLTPIEMKMD